MKKIFLWRLCMTASILPLLAACQIFPPEEALPAAPVIRSYEAQEYTQTPVIRGDLFLTKRVSCEYIPAKKEQLSFSLGGEYIDRIYAGQGDQVQAGELLAELVKNDLPEKISTQEYEIQVLELKKEHIQQNMELELSRLKALGTGQARQNLTQETFETQLQEIEDSLYIQKLQLEELQEELKSRQIYAGISGTVTFVRSLTPGQRSEEGKIMITVADMDSSAFTIKGDNAQYFPVGTQAVILKSGAELTAVSVELSALGTAASANAGDPIAYLRLLQPDPSLEDGAKGYIEITLDSRYDVLYINKKAIKTADNRHFVYILNEDGLKTMQDVTIGLESGEFVEITSGLQEGDSVIVG